MATTLEKPASPQRPEIGKHDDAFRAARRAEKRAATRQKIADFFIRFVFVLFLLGLWQILHAHFVVKTEAWSGALFPSPKQVGEWLWQGTGLSYLNGGYEPPPEIGRAHV